MQSLGGDARTFIWRAWFFLMLNKQNVIPLWLWYIRKKKNKIYKEKSYWKYVHIDFLSFSMKFTMFFSQLTRVIFSNVTYTQWVIKGNVSPLILKICSYYLSFFLNETNNILFRLEKKKNNMNKSHIERMFTLFIFFSE